MSRDAATAGVGALAFGVLAFVAMVVANPPGGNYKSADVASFIAKGHRPAVFVAAYLMVIAAVGLLLALARLRAKVEDPARRVVFWGLSVAAVAGWLVGFLIAVSPSLGLAYSGGHLTDVSHPVAYVIGEGGWGVMYGAGGILLGCALLTFATGTAAVPRWVRWATGVAALASLAALAWFPFFLVFVWAIVLGLWTLVADRGGASEVVPAAQPM
jgi:hypothetical protein